MASLKTAEEVQEVRENLIAETDLFNCVDENKQSFKELSHST